MGKRLHDNDKKPVWHLLSRCGEKMWLLCTACGDVLRYAPLYIISVKLNTGRRCREAERYQLVESCEVLPSHERLRWCRYRAGLLQREVAAQVGITRSAYMDMENGLIDYWPKETVDKLADLFCVMLMYLLDGYNRFLYSGQGSNIETLRNSLGMSKRAFARYLGVNRALLVDRAAERKRISKQSWEKYFAGKNLLD